SAEPPSQEISCPDGVLQALRAPVPMYVDKSVRRWWQFPWDQRILGPAVGILSTVGLPTFLQHTKNSVRAFRTLVTQWAERDRRVASDPSYVQAVDAIRQSEEVISSALEEPVPPPGIRPVAEPQARAVLGSLARRVPTEAATGGGGPGGGGPGGGGPG